MLVAIGYSPPTKCPYAYTVLVPSSTDDDKYLEGQFLQGLNALLECCLPAGDHQGGDGCCHAGCRRGQDRSRVPTLQGTLRAANVELSFVV